MNIFYFYDCPKLSAKAQPDKMLVKMPLETAQERAQLIVF